MTTITAKIIADSISSEGHRLTTMQLRYPRWIHAELMTHRQFSRNASSSRAIPVVRMIQDVLDDPAVPMFWGANQKGMQAGEECTTPIYLEGACHFDMMDRRYDPISREKAWLWAMKQAIATAEAFDKAGYHKQIVNRLLEPFSHINVVVTATEWSNFFALRRHKDAEPHINLLANRMFDAMAASEPNELQPRHWHTPYVADNDKDIWDYSLKHDLDLQDVAIKCSVARCARVSYLTHEGKRPVVADDLSLYDRLIGGEVLHASPTEHQAKPDRRIKGSKPYEKVWEEPSEHGNFVGWRQYRKTIPGECL